MARAMSSINRENMRFVVFDAPSDSTLPLYLAELKDRNVKCVVRIPQKTLEYRCMIGHSLMELGEDVITNFLKLCDEMFVGNELSAIGVHCIAGLGRAPVLVAIALIESGMVPLEAVEYVRRQRRGAFNSVQLSYLAESYKLSKKSAKINPNKSVDGGELKKKSSSSFLGSITKAFKKS
ncbi:Protein tyrosine phosphatase type IVA 1 [Physocladia obscura]|uniref:Protein tyrosine phosphatase type IVA 1 n=1 Tax=Physocladia obscura TaxID=109957 RepID=A0AAD5SWC9_9FUNG|nr:Protein tyrosine phosphatase type IVA 1 [Physocladia obscura]